MLNSLYRAFIRTLPALVLTIGCDDPPPSTIAECAALDEAVAAEECFYTVIRDHKSDINALKDAIQRIPSASSRDLVRLRLAVSDPVAFGTVCRDAESIHAQSRCEHIIYRPHLLTMPREPK